MHDREDTLDSGSGHLRKRVGQQRVPVAIAPIDRGRDAARIEFRTQRGDEISNLTVERANSVEVEVVLGDFEQSFARDVSAARHVF